MRINVQVAKTDFSKLIRLLETGQEESIIVTKNEKPIVIMTPYPKKTVKNRIGIAEGKFHDPENFNKYDDEIASLFSGEES